MQRRSVAKIVLQNPVRKKEIKLFVDFLHNMLTDHLLGREDKSFDRHKHTN